jgi:sugar/nucleoside kinase (ribokinase family)
MKKSLVIGDLNVDVIISGMTELPELGREILCKNIQTVLGGSASIFACRLAQLGAQVDMYGKVGNDENGRIILDTLKSNNVSTEKVIIDDNLKTGVTVSLTYPKDKALVTFIGSIGALQPSDITPDLFKGYDHLHVSSIYLQPKILGALPRVFSWAKKAELTTSLDTQDDPSGKFEKIWEILAYVDVFLPNKGEALAITGAEVLDKALDIFDPKTQTVVVKCGSKGAVGRARGETVRAKPFKINPVDTTGAGDSFNAGFIYYYLCKRKSLKSSIIFANTMGALSCLYVGGAGGKITEDDVLEFALKHDHLGILKGRK